MQWCGTWGCPHKHKGSFMQGMEIEAERKRKCWPDYLSAGTCGSPTESLGCDIIQETQRNTWSSERRARRENSNADKGTKDHGCEHLQITGFGTLTRSRCGWPPCNIDRNCQFASSYDCDKCMPATSRSCKNPGGWWNDAKSARQGGRNKKSTIENSWIMPDRWSRFCAKCSYLQPGMAAF